MTRLWAAFGVIVVLALGWIRLLRLLHRLEAKKEFAREFLAKLADYATSNGENFEAYTWMVHRSSKMQGQLGRSGVFAMYRPPFSDEVWRNVQIMNLLGELPRWMGDEGGMRLGTTQSFVRAIHEALIRNIGELDDRSEIIATSLRNPLVWFREGISMLLVGPLVFLQGLGLASDRVVNRVAQSALIRVVSGVVGLLSIVGAIIGIVTGWNPFVEILTKSQLLEPAFTATPAATTTSSSTTTASGTGALTPSPISTPPSTAAASSQPSVAKPSPKAARGQPRRKSTKGQKKPGGETPPGYWTRDVCATTRR